jgi:predicted small integral membrane protein
MTEADRIDALFDCAMVLAVFAVLAILGFGGVAGLRWLGLDMSYWWAGLPAALALLFLAWLLIKARI